MKTPLAVCLALSLASLSATARVRAVQRPASIPVPRSVMWIAAHPDDESLVAPLLATWCRDQHARCGILIVTRGDSGPCLRPGGCAPDLATVRSGEEGEASQYFGADLTLLTYPDGGGTAPPLWSSGDRPDLTTTIAAYIQAFGPDVIMTFDPRHGSTCHPDHRAVANVVLDAVKRLQNQPQVYLLETRVAVTTEPFALRISSAAPAATRFDANTLLEFTKEPAWNAIIDDMRRHPSQFDDRWITAIQNTPSSQRAVYVGRAEDILQQPVETCP